MGSAAEVLTFGSPCKQVEKLGGTVEAPSLLAERRQCAGILVAQRKRQTQVENPIEISHRSLHHRVGEVVEDTGDDGLIGDRGERLGQVEVRAAR